MKKIFFDPGFLSFEDVKRLAAEFKNLELIRHRPRDLIEYQKRGINVTGYPLAKDFSKHSSIKSDPSKIWLSVINDHQTLLLLDRDGGYDKRVPVFIQELTALCLAYQGWLEEQEPGALIYTVTPHNIKTWVLARVAEELDIPVLYFQQSIFPWRQFLLKGLRQQPEVLPIGNTTLSEGDKKSLSEFVKRKLGNRDLATPAYERERLKKNRGYFVNLWTEAPRFFRHPKEVINKVRCYYTYQQLSVRKFDREDFVCFFLHFQPERTSVPEGYGFGVQKTAILTLLCALPPSCLLIIKEHPSTFTNKCSTKFRDPDFYRDIASLDERVRFAPISTDPYHLIDQGIATASITGTILGEALIRGKPVVCFGSGPLQAVNQTAFHRYSDHNLLSQFLSVAQQESGSAKRTLSFNSEQYFKEICDVTTSGLDSSDTCFDEARSLEINSRSVLRALSNIPESV